ncbi:MAG: KUP/HAK/KT family potassium transporter [Proteobacteria bacterium]|nr:KUP/HAK/KT family potassium transporter [Pseudomonadota bacterium]
MSHSPSTSHSNDHKALMLGALGVVFGDIGTSPLYALKVSIEASGVHAGQPIQPAVLGILSLITWALVLVVMIKYVFIIMRADNKGSGGIFALTALVTSALKKDSRGYWAVVVIGALGAALFFGDSLITPAISVLSAVEGLKVISPDLGAYVTIVAIAMIAALFAVERFGTAKIGKAFGPIMLAWFATLALLGLQKILEHPEVLAALNPLVGVQYLMNHPGVAVAIMGSVVLAVTGGEALYADMGHFGLLPIRKAWIYMVFPCLLLNYYGQGALLVVDPSALDNPFYRLAPDWALVPLLVLASMATIIASQAVITGAFSTATQAVHLGYIPRLRVRHTSADEIGQVYVSKINLFLFLGVVILILSFGSSERLASAYGVTVTGAMLIDTLLGAVLMIHIRKWNPLFFIPVFGAFLLLDTVFLSTNLTKFFLGGWVPVTVALVLLGIMLAWIHGREKLLKARWNAAIPLDKFIADLDMTALARVEGTSIFMVPHDHIAPATLLHNLKHNKVLHERVILMNIETVNEPFVEDAVRATIRPLPHNIFSVHVQFGFMEDMHVMRAVAFLRARGFAINTAEISFFVGKEKVVATHSSGLLLAPFIYMHRTMQGAAEYFKVPFNHAIEVGGYIEI